MPDDSPSLVNIPGPGPAFSTMSARTEANAPMASERVGTGESRESIEIPSEWVRRGGEHYPAADGAMGIPLLRRERLAALVEGFDGMTLRHLAACADARTRPAFVDPAATARDLAAMVETRGRPTVGWWRRQIKVNPMAPGGNGPDT
jgi:hypothetical protein